MICPYCGQENPEDIEVCGFCGGSLLVEQPIVDAQPTEGISEVSTTTSQAQKHQLTTNPIPTPPSGGIYGNKVWWIVGCLVFLCLIFGCISLGLWVYRYSGLSGWLNPATVTPVLPLAQAATNTSLPTLPPTQALLPIITTTVSTLRTDESTAVPLSSTPGMLFFDDFSDPTSGWDQVDEANYSTNYFENAYRIVVNTKMSDSWANPEGLEFDDVQVEVDATKYAGSDDNDFGLICRYTATDQYYYAVISSDGYFGITKVTPESSVILGRDNLEYSDLIKQGYVTNHIQFDCIGEVLTLSANGQMLDRQVDYSYSSGNVGLIAGSYDTPGTDILFDNFRVSTP